MHRKCNSEEIVLLPVHLTWSFMLRHMKGYSFLKQSSWTEEFGLILCLKGICSQGPGLPISSTMPESSKCLPKRFHGQPKSSLFDFLPHFWICGHGSFSCSDYLTLVSSINLKAVSLLNVYKARNHLVFRQRNPLREPALFFTGDSPSRKVQMFH